VHAVAAWATEISIANEAIVVKNMRTKMKKSNLKRVVDCLCCQATENQFTDGCQWSETGL